MEAATKTSAALAAGTASEPSLCTDTGTAAQPDTAKTERTLRIDFQFSGNVNEQHIAISEISCFSGWYGRRSNLGKVPVRGNGDITMADAQTGETLYATSFSSLFQEWLTTEEATRASKSFENTFLLPMPEKPVKITVRLFDNPDNPVTLTQEIDPSDILIRNLDALPVTPHKYLHKSGDPKEKIDVAILAEGYTKDEAELFYAHAMTAAEAILSHEPFKSCPDKFNFVAVAAESMDSDVSIPKEGIWRNTALGSNFSTFYSDRYLTTLNVSDIHDLLARIPYEHIIILANTHTYGGGGIYNSYTLTTTHHADFRPVVVHEFGHSFGALADEYFYDDQYVNTYSPDAEPWEQNITTLKDFSGKWSGLIPEGTVIPTTPDPENPGKIGVFEGGGYMSKGVYRARYDCRMKTNQCADFCPACQKAIMDMITFYTE